jgi:hypothetical protein
MKLMRCLSPTMTRNRLEQSHFLLIALIAGAVMVAALGGAWWKSTNISQSAHVPPALGAPTAIAGPPPAQPAWKTLRRAYIGRSKEQFDENLTIISRLLNGQGSEVIRLISLIIRDMAPMPPEMRPERYAAMKPSALEAQTLLEQIHKKIYDQILIEYRDQSADLTDILERPDALVGVENAIGRLLSLYNNFEELSKALRPEMLQNVKILFGAQREPLQTAMNEFSAWIGGCNSRIEAKRIALGP